LVLPLGVVFVFAGVGLFALTTYRFANSLWNFGLKVSEVPLSFTFAPHIPDAFFAPVSALLVLTAVVIAMTTAFIFTGAAIAKKRTSFGLSLAGYFIVYSFIAAWWRIRAISDIAFGVKRSWR